MIKYNPMPSNELWMVESFMGSDKTGEPDFRIQVEGINPVETDLLSANAVSSAIRNTEGLLHKPLLDLDMAAKLIPSSTEGHFHLYIDKPMTWDNYIKLLDVMAEVGILEQGFVDASKYRKATFLRLPHVKK